MDTFDMLLEPVRSLLQEVGGFVPRLLLSVLIAVAGWLVAKALGLAVVKALRTFNFQVLAERAGTDDFLRQGGSSRDTCEVFGLIAFWFAVVVTLTLVFTSLQVDPVTDVLGRVLLFFPRLVVALLIVVFGSYFARFVGQAAAGRGHGAGLADAELLGRLARWAVMAFVLLLALDHLDIGGGLLQQTFLILLAGAVLALALAFGLGGRHRAARLLDRWFPRRDDTRP